MNSFYNASLLLSRSILLSLSRWSRIKKLSVQVLSHFFFTLTIFISWVSVQRMHQFLRRYPEIYPIYHSTDVFFICHSFLTYTKLYVHFQEVYFMATYSRSQEANEINGNGCYLIWYWKMAVFTYLRVTPHAHTHLPAERKEQIITLLVTVWEKS